MEVFTIVVRLPVSDQHITMRLDEMNRKKNQPLR